MSKCHSGVKAGNKSAIFTAIILIFIIIVPKGKKKKDKKKKVIIAETPINPSLITTTIHSSLVNKDKENFISWSPHFCTLMCPNSLICLFRCCFLRNISPDI